MPVNKRALLIVDFQNDFCPGGSLAVSDCDLVVHNLNRYIALFSNKGLPIFASRDWHPKETSHFKKSGGPWPEHCVENTKGAEFHPLLKISGESVILSKGMDPKKDGYTVFEARNKDGREFIDLLKESSINELFIGGLATDYCVKETVINALQQGFRVKLLEDAIQGVDVRPGDSQRAIKQMLKAKAQKITFTQAEIIVTKERGDE